MKSVWSMRDSVGRSRSRRKGERSDEGCGGRRIRPLRNAKDVNGEGFAGKSKELVGVVKDLGVKGFRVK
jgi:hypothetical protein